MTDHFSHRTSYMKGRDAEHRIIQKLAVEGFRFIIRSAASRGPIDVLASNGKEILAIQVKKNGYLNVEEKTRLVQWANVFNAKPMIAKKQKGRWRLRSCI